MTDLQRRLDLVRTDYNYCGQSYNKWESYASGLLSCMFGYTQWHWWTEDGDSFGPLVRGVRARNENGLFEEAMYG